MTDRELLELAARAAGITPLHWTDDGENPEKSRPVLTDGVRECVVIWDPLDDSGDAFDLAIKLRLRVNPDSSVEYGPYKFGSFDKKRDPYASTRRAITRAAAEIGKEMK